MFERLKWRRIRRRTTPSVDPFINEILQRALDPRRATYMREKIPSMFNSVPFEGPGPRLSNEELLDVESRNGFLFPSRFRQLLTEVGDGGYGPGHGMLPIIARQVGRRGPSAFDLYRAYYGAQDEPGWSWPEGLLPLGDWGCLIFSCLDCSSSAGRIVRVSVGNFDPEEGGDLFRDHAKEEAASLDEWLSKWLNGEEQVHV
jgi:hypothetical protein